MPQGDMQLSSYGESFLKQFEGCKLEAYLDSAGVWTIGWGHTPASQGQRISQAQADAWFTSDVNTRYANKLNEYLHNGKQALAPTTQNQFDAMLSLMYNIGSGAFKTSSVLRYHLQGDYEAASRAFASWNKIHKDGELVVSQGLASRRAKEAAIYLEKQPITTPHTTHPQTQPQSQPANPAHPEARPDLKPSPAPSQNTMPQPTNTSTSGQINTLHTLRRGDQGEAVKTLQQNLITLGAGIAADGDFGELTETAVLNYQSRIGLQPNGIADPILQTRLIDEVARIKG